MRRRWWFQQLLLLRKVSCCQSFSTFIMTAFVLKEQNKDLQTLRDSSEKKGLHPILPPSPFHSRLAGVQFNNAANEGRWKTDIFLSLTDIWNRASQHAECKRSPGQNSCKSFNKTFRLFHCPSMATTNPAVKNSRKLWPS